MIESIIAGVVALLGIILIIVRDISAGKAIDRKELEELKERVKNVKTQHDIESIINDIS